MPTYRLRCFHGFLEGLQGCEIDRRAIEAESPAGAIALAKLYAFPNPPLKLLSASLSAPIGNVIWSMQSEVPPKGDVGP